MKELIEYIARTLVDDAESVSVEEIPSGHSVILELQVAPKDMGKVIGRQGRIARAMRTLLKVAAAREGRRASLEIL